MVVNKPNKKRRIVVNKYYQLKTSFGVAGLFALCIGILFIVNSLIMAWNNRELSHAITKQMDLQKVQEDIIQSIEMLSKYGHKKNLIFEAYRAIGDLTKNASALKESNEIVQQTILIHTYLMWINGMLAAILIAVVFVIILRQSHKVAGPMFLLKRYMQEIIDGKVPHIRPLRKGDEFKDVFETFALMVEKLHLKRRRGFVQHTTSEYKG